MNLLFDTFVTVAGKRHHPPVIAALITVVAPFGINGPAGLFLPVLWRTPLPAHTMCDQLSR